jgi:hypothetical protein
MKSESQSGNQEVSPFMKPINQLLSLQDPVAKPYHELHETKPKLHTVGPKNPP